MEKRTSRAGFNAAVLGAGLIVIGYMSHGVIDSIDANKRQATLNADREKAISNWFDGIGQLNPKAQDCVQDAVQALKEQTMSQDLTMLAFFAQGRCLAQGYGNPTP